MTRTRCRVTAACCAAGIVAISLSASAENYYFKSDATDFSVASNYTIGSASGSESSVIPGPSDIVYLAKQTKTYSLTSGTANFGAFAQVGEFRVEAWSAITFSLTVPSGSAAITNMFNLSTGARSRDTARWFTIEKLGAGELVLSGLNNYPSGHAQNEHWNYEVKLRVKEGSIAFDTTDFSGAYIVTGILDLSAGATAKVPFSETKDLTWMTGGFSGAGLITNICMTTGRKTLLGDGIGHYTQDFKFSGAIGGPIQPTFTSENDLRDSRSSFPYNASVSANDAEWTDAAGLTTGPSLRRITVVDKLGNSGELSPLGTASIVLAVYGGELYYDGTGETTDKCLLFASPTDDNKWPVCLNAGAVGGLVWKLNGTRTYWKHTAGDLDMRFILRGENTKPCVVNCPIQSNAGYGPNFMKRGTGKWVIANAANDFGGAVFVEEGTLGFTTLEERGVTSSLGTSLRLHKWYDNKVTRATLDALDGAFAFTLGCPTNDATVGALEYLGSARTKCLTRPFGLNGTGGVINNGSGELILGNATVMTENKSTALYLGGTNDVASTFYDVTNGVGQVTVVKNDSGTWRLAHNIDIDAVEVKGGTLVLEKTTGRPYTWFRYVLKEALNIDNTGAATSANWPISQEFCLYDAAGNRQLINPGYQEEVVNPNIASPRDYRLIGPNSLAYDSTGAIAWGGSSGSDRGATNLFDNASSGAGMWLTKFNGSTTAPSVANPSSWIKLVMRMPENAPTVTACDIVIDANGSYGAELAAWALEGSRNGIDWESVTNVCWKTSNTQYTRHRVSYSGKTGAKGCYCSAIDRGLGVEDYGWVPGDTTPRPNLGYSFAGVVTNTYLFPTRLSSVTISGGGLLRIESDVAPAVDTLTVDATTGGTISNVTYAATGTLNLVNVGADQLITVPGSLSGLRLAGWTVNLPQGIRNRTITMKNGQIQIRKNGFLVIVK